MLPERSTEGHRSGSARAVGTSRASAKARATDVRTARRPVPDGRSNGSSHRRRPSAAAGSRAAFAYGPARDPVAFGGPPCTGEDGLDDRAGRDREPGPGEQRRPQVVAADVGVDVERGEQAGHRGRDAGQQRVPREAQGGHDERRRHEPGEDAQLGSREPGETHRLGREAREALDVALELAGQHDVPEAAPGLGVPVDQRRRERARSQRQLQVQQRCHAQAGRQRGDDQAGPVHDTRVHREDVQPDGGDQQDREAMVGQRHPEQRGGQHDPTVRPPRGRRVVRGGVPLGHQAVPAHEGEDEGGDEEQVQGVGVGGGRDAPGDRRQRQADGSRHRDRQRHVEPAQQQHGDPDGTRDEQGGEQVHPECLVAQRLQDDRRHPAHEDIGREARRVHRAHQGRHGLGLGRVPGEDPRQERGPVDQQRRHGDEQPGEVPASASGRHARPPARRATRQGSGPRSRPTG